MRSSPSKFLVDLFRSFISADHNSGRHRRSVANPASFLFPFLSRFSPDRTTRTLIRLQTSRNTRHNHNSRITCLNRVSPQKFRGLWHIRARQTSFSFFSPCFYVSMKPLYSILSHQIPSVAGYVFCFYSNLQAIVRMRILCMKRRTSHGSRRCTCLELRG